MPRLSDPWWLYSPGTGASSPYKFFLAIWNVGNGRDWSYQRTFIKRTSIILAITDYFSKWVEAIPLRKVKTSDVIKFIKHYMVYLFGVPRWIVHDNDLSLSAKHSKDSATSSESRVCLHRHTTPPLMALQKLSIRLLGNFSRNLSRKANATGMIS